MSSNHTKRSREPGQHYLLNLARRRLEDRRDDLLLVAERQGLTPEQAHLLQQIEAWLAEPEE